MTLWHYGSVHTERRCSETSRPALFIGAPLACNLLRRLRGRPTSTARVELEQGWADTAVRGPRAARGQPSGFLGVRAHPVSSLSIHASTAPTSAATTRKRTCRSICATGSSARPRVGIGYASQGRSDGAGSGLQKGRSWTRFALWRAALSQARPLRCGSARRVWPWPGTGAHVHPGSAAAHAAGAAKSSGRNRPQAARPDVPSAARRGRSRRAFSLLCSRPSAAARRTDRLSWPGAANIRVRSGAYSWDRGCGAEGGGRRGCVGGLADGCLQQRASTRGPTVGLGVSSDTVGQHGNVNAAPYQADSGLWGLHRRLGPTRGPTSCSRCRSAAEQPEIRSVADLAHG